MRYTLLELVKRVLESMESDEVSDINETSESVTVANIIKECYFDIAGQFNPAELEGLFKLDAGGDNTKPVLMTMPSTASRVMWLKYNIGAADRPDWQDLQYMSNEEFFEYQSGLDPDATNLDDFTHPVNNADFVFLYKNDDWPQYYTIFDDYTVIMDSYLATEENTLTQVRTLAYGPLVAEFEMENEWVPDLDPRQFQLLLQESKATAFQELKQTTNAKAEAKSRKNQILTQKNKYDNRPSWAGQDRVSFGRHGGNSSYSNMQRAMRRGS